MSQAWNRFVTTTTRDLEKLETEFHRAYWDSQVKATPENDRRRADLELQLRRLKGDPQKLAEVEEALQQELHDPKLQRQLEVLRLSFTGNQMQDSHRSMLVELSTEVESEYASYRPRVDGRAVSENEIEEILKTSSDAELRRRTWMASKEIGVKVAGKVRELARVRNEVARDLGHADYYRFALGLQEIDEDWLFSTLDRLEELTREPFLAWKAELDAHLRRRFNTDAIFPWHYADPFFQSVPPDGRISLDRYLDSLSAEDLAVRTFASWGIDLGQITDQSDLFPRENKSQHAFCLDVDRAGDVRILANVVPGERWVEVMLHESGHAAYDVSINPYLPYLLRRAAHTFVTEAIAILSGRLVRNPEWLKEVARIDSSTVDELRPDLAVGRVAQSLVFTRWGLVVVHFERALYDDPEADLDPLWWDLVERFQFVSPPPGRSAPDWAAKIHVAAAPVYYHNYLLGEMLASQIVSTCEEECGGFVANPDAGRLMVERIFAQGASLRWDELINNATGRPLGAEDFAAGLVTSSVG
ncbi:MAG: M2 family metallopeptidase [Actinomycetota bacterium]|nr:M2 family metallopeptidase [Actinomycetota bacterium]